MRTDKSWPALMLSFAPAIALLVGALGAASSRDAEAAPAKPLEVAPGVYRSAQPDAVTLRAAREQGLRTVVVLRTKVPAEERSTASELGLDLVHVPMDGSKMPTIEEVDRALAVILEPAKRPVLVHCAHGEERTGAVMAAYRVVVEGWDPADAEAEAVGLGFGFDGLREFLVRYREHWQRR